MKFLLARAIAFALSCMVFNIAAASPLTVMPLGDSLTEGLCTDGSDSNTPASTCYEPYYEPANAYIYNRYDAQPTFCGDFSRQMVENYNHGATGGYRGPLLNKLQAAGVGLQTERSVVCRRRATACAQPQNQACSRAKNPHYQHRGWGVIKSHTFPN